MTQQCFLCNPNRSLVYAEDEGFFAMLSLGPIVEGLSLLATESHMPSMLDLSIEDSERLCEFTFRVRHLLRSHYGEVVATEHGRVPPCEYLDMGGREAHCFHAHRVLFPLSVDLGHTMYDHGLRVEEYSSFVEARHRFAREGEYLYYERADGSCLIAAAPKRLVRQFFRYKVAECVGHPEFASWREYPRLGIVEAARARLMQ
jgi:hypothetical protein